MPAGPALYPRGQVTNVTEEFRIAELIREKVYLLTAQEVPYTAEVRVEHMEEKTDKSGNPMLCVSAAILTLDERRQRMFIGRKAQKIREIGTAARQDLEARLGKKVFLDLNVLVDRKWVERMP